MTKDDILKIIFVSCGHKLLWHILGIAKIALARGVMCGLVHNFNIEVKSHISHGKIELESSCPPDVVAGDLLWTKCSATSSRWKLVIYIPSKLDESGGYLMSDFKSKIFEPLRKSLKMQI